jgi:hypothetical protein
LAQRSKKKPKQDLEQVKTINEEIHELLKKNQSFITKRFGKFIVNVLPPMHQKKTRLKIFGHKLRIFSKDFIVSVNLWRSLKSKACDLIFFQGRLGRQKTKNKILEEV